MKKDIHPSNYRAVVFKDIATDESFLTKSCVNTKDTITWEDGKEYPLFKVHISSSSHPFYTGTEKLLDMEGRVDRFKARQEAAKKAQEARIKSANKTRAKKTEKTDEKTEKQAA